MASTPREWPNNAREARDQAAEAANDAITTLLPVLKNISGMGKEEILQRVAIALNANQTIARLLESQGAQTRPPTFR
jgi:hypothetical protein